MEEKLPKKRGPKPTYLNQAPYQEGAPKLISRLDPSLIEWVASRPEGKRPYLERIIGQDKRRTEEVSAHQGDSA